MLPVSTTLTVDEGHTPWSVIGPFLCLQGDKTVKTITVKQQPPITVADLNAGATYHLRVSSYELNSISSESVSFKTKPGEPAPVPTSSSAGLLWLQVGNSVYSNSVKVGYYCLFLLLLLQ